MTTAAIHHALILTKHMFKADGVMFYWINEEQQSASITEQINVPQSFIDHYHNEMQALDPLNVKSFLKTRGAFNSLTDCRLSSNQHQLSDYERYIRSYGIEETFDILFWKNDHAYAGIGITNPNLKKMQKVEIEALHFMLEQNLLQLKPIQKRIMLNHLESFKLTHREKQVCLCLMDGYSNAEIAKSMGITVGTVKINLNRILHKLNLSCRLQVSKLLNQLFQPS
ncbi:helix-turn-helix domain-containing protein [Acinetobacter terrae]|uniref:LuxR family transcriptional regulator n=1 Tax=Acinetobacter terrae TaxID=2731247 RepID=A0A4R0EFD1_9GAMM|nr:helix-turn-helix transcriptional regulator [Acinetobacter terrae]TCB54787.1 LuxR family transcriptional regulator [Acinetobacter terrae]